MLRPDFPQPATADSLDKIATDLQELRASAGSVSYAEIVRRIKEIRTQRGVDAFAASPPRSTVYGLFQVGRKRMDVELLRDTVAALGMDPEESELWVQRYLSATKPQDTSPRAVEPPPQPIEEAHGSNVNLTATVTILLFCVMLNHGIHDGVIEPLGLPLYLDMIGTALASLCLGPWQGVLVALISGSIGELIQDGIWAFTLVNVAGALIWGYGVRKFRFGQSITSFFVLNFVVATVCSLLATPILVALFGGAYGSVGNIAQSLQTAGMPFIAATFTSNISTSVIDKLLTGFIALTLFGLLHSKLKLPADHLRLVQILDSHKALSELDFKARRFTAIPPLR